MEKIEARLMFNTVLINLMINLTDELVNDLSNEGRFKFDIKQSYNKLNKLQEEYLKIVHEICVNNDMEYYSWDLANFGLDLLESFKPETYSEKFQLLVYFTVWLASSIVSVEEDDRNYLMYNKCKSMIICVGSIMKLEKISLYDDCRIKYNEVILNLMESKSKIFGVINTNLPEDLLQE